MAAKTFILGVGAQKAGTTWLHAYLSSQPSVAAGPFKEYHIWDAVSLPLFSNFRVAAAQADLSQRDRLRRQMQNDESVYFDFFMQILRAPGKSIAYDITPSYSALPVAVLQKIDSGFASRGMDMKAVFLMRDPVERCWSAARDSHQREQGNTRASAEYVLAHALSPQSQSRTNYRLTLDNLVGALQPGRRYVGLYEEMHTVEKITALSDFCGVASQPEKAAIRANVSRKVDELDPRVAAAIARHFRPIYDMAAARFPEAGQLWTGFRYL